MIPPFVCDDNFLNDDEIKTILEYCSRYEMITGQAGGETARNSQILFVSRNDETQWLYDKFENLLKGVNDVFYQFNLIGFPPIQYGEYDASYNGKYDWHMDMQVGKDIYKDNEKTRKLSITVLLNEPGVDFQGGEFEISSSFSERKGIEETELKKGTAIVFPSFMIHRVKPVIEGKRKSLVIWAEGPRFV